MPRSSLSELLFALAFAVVTTGIAGFIVTSDSQGSSRERLHEIEKLKADRCALQIQSIRHWVDADAVGDRRAKVEQVVRAKTRRSLKEFNERRVFEEVEAVYRELQKSMQP